LAAPGGAAAAKPGAAAAATPATASATLGAAAATPETPHKEDSAQHYVFEACEGVQRCWHNTKHTSTTWYDPAKKVMGHFPIFDRI